LSKIIEIEKNILKIKLLLKAPLKNAIFQGLFSKASFIIFFIEMYVYKDSVNFFVLSQEHIFENSLKKLKNARHFFIWQIFWGRTILDGIFAKILINTPNVLFLYSDLIMLENGHS
jgi:hypothetical protein